MIRLAGLILSCIALLFENAPLIAAEPGHAAQEPAAATDIVVRCAVIGGMTDTGFWPALAERFEQSTGIRSEVVVTGPKAVIAKALVSGEVDLIVMHVSDTMINLVADGYGENPQPWARNDLLLVGPQDDPAKIRGETDVVAALKKILASGNRLVMHRSLGANEVLHDLLAAGELELPAQQTVLVAGDRHREMLRQATTERAYALVGRIPFLNGKIPSGEMTMMVRDDVRMRRPYLVVTATEKRIGKTQHAAATKLAAFLRTPETQRFIAEFGRGDLDDQPLFFPVVVEP